MGWSGGFGHFIFSNTLWKAAWSLSYQENKINTIFSISAPNFCYSYFLWSLNIILVFFKGFFLLLIMCMHFCLCGVCVHECMSDPLEWSYMQLWAVKCGSWEVNLAPPPLIHFSSPNTNLCTIQKWPCLSHYCLFNSYSLSVFTIQCYFFQGDVSDLQDRIRWPSFLTLKYSLCGMPHYFVIDFVPK